jgi:hypothetical protein
MNINWSEFEKGFNELAKEANFVGDIAGNILKNYTDKALGGLANKLEGLGIGGIPQGGFLPPQMPNITINMAKPGNLLDTTTGVHSINNPVIGTEKLAGEKTAGIIDPNVLRSVLTANAVKGIVNTVTDQHGNTIPAEEHKDVILESKYPEMKKLLADPSTKAYLESLLTEDSNNAR